MATATERQRDRLQSQLANLGFTRSRRGEGYRHNGVAFNPEGSWSTLYSTESLVDVDPLCGLLHQPGAWKYVVGRDGTVRKTFDVPTSVLDLQDDDEELGDVEDAETPLEGCLKWAMATDRSEIPSGWKGPERADLDTWMSPQALTIQCGPVVRQGMVVSGVDRLAIRFPIVQSLPPGLSENRLVWLRAVLIEGQNRWRMVRIGLSDQGAEAEIDLTGAPQVILEPLFKTSLDALRWVVEWLVVSAAFLADPAVTCRAWEVCPSRAAPAGRRDAP